MKARFGDRGLKTQGPLNPPSTEILALNPSYGIVSCRGDFFLSLFFFFFFWWPSFFLMDSLTRSTPPSPSIHSVFLFFFSFWFMTCFLFRSKKKWNEAWSPVLCSPNILSDQKLFTKERFLKWTLFIPSKFSNQANGKCKCLTCKLKLLLN